MFTRAPSTSAAEYLRRCRSAMAWLRGHGFAVEAIADLRFAIGIKAADGRFDNDPAGEGWIVFPERDDVVFWSPATGQFATWYGRAFAIGEVSIDNPATYAFDCNLNIYKSPIDWLYADRDGIVVIDWARAFDWLRDAPRIAVAEALWPTYRKQMRPARLPEVFVLQARRAAA